MKPSLLVPAIALALLATPAAAQGPTLYVDAVNGVDAPGGGGPASPLRTLTYAIGLVGPLGPATFRLRPGVYGAPSETFPIAVPDLCVVEADPALVARGAQSVVISGTPSGAGHTSAVRVGGSGAGAVDVTLRNLLIEGVLGNAAYVAVQVDGPAGTGALNFRAEDCVLDHYRDLVVLTTGNTVATVTAERCTMRGLDEQVRVTARGTSVVALGIDRGILNGGWIGADLIANGGTIVAQLRGLRIVDSGLQGIRMGTTNNGAINLRAEHCLFRKGGQRVVNLPTGNYGAITDDPTAVAGTRQVLVENSIFWGNVNDCPHYAAGSYTFGVNIVQQANLIGVGGNFNSAPAFVEASTNDYRLLPGSPAIDVGDPAATTLPEDFEGDPRPGGSAPDLGPDEHHPLYLYSKGPARVGGPAPAALTFRALAPPGTLFGGFAAFGQNNLPWGPGVLHLTPPFVGPVFLATIGANGLGQSSITLPVAPGLVGLELWWQGGFAVAPYFGVNPHRVLLRL